MLRDHKKEGQGIPSYNFPNNANNMIYMLTRPYQLKLLAELEFRRARGAFDNLSVNS